MMIKRIPGATRVLGKSQGYLGLPVLDEQIEDSTSGQTVNTMTTAWEPDPREMDRMQRGANVHVRIFGVSHPPIMLWVDQPAEDFVRLSVGACFKNRRNEVRQIKSCVLTDGGNIYSDGDLIYLENGVCLNKDPLSQLVADYVEGTEK